MLVGVHDAVLQPAIASNAEVDLRLPHDQEIGWEGTRCRRLSNRTGPVNSSAVSSAELVRLLAMTSAVTSVYSPRMMARSTSAQVSVLRPTVRSVRHRRHRQDPLANAQVASFLRPGRPCRDTSASAPFEAGGTWTARREVTRAFPSPPERRRRSSMSPRCIVRGVRLVVGHNSSASPLRTSPPGWTRPGSTASCREDAGVLVPETSACVSFTFVASSPRP